MTQEEFSEKFKELFTGMIQAAYDFVDHSDEVDEIYVYSDMEGGMTYFKAFYRIKGELVRMHQVNSVLSNEVDTGMSRTLDTLDQGMEDTDKIRALFEEFQGEVPAHMKFKYTLSTNKFDSEIVYELKHTNSEDLWVDHIFDQWFEEVQGEAV